jgi:metal-responsive CopG/Arc/MetJ family transcriptional regulator
MQERTTIQISNNLRKELRQLAAKKDKNYQELLKDMISVFKELDKDKTIVSIPKKLSEKIKATIKKADFNSISEYITFILRLMLYEKIEKEDIDEKAIKQKLKSLGYI